MLVAWNLDDFEVGLACPEIDLGLDLEPVAIDIEEVKASSPEGDIAVAEIGKGCLEELVDDLVQHAVAKSAESRDIVRFAVVQKAGAFGDVGAGQQSVNKAGYLVWI